MDRCTFLYNRVEDIERKAEEISMLVPDARVAYAHGQMPESRAGIRHP